MDNSTLVLILAGLGFSVVSAVVAGGTVAVVLRRIGNDKSALDNAEKLFLSFPPATLDIIKQLTDTLDAAVDFIKKTTDGQPNENLPPTG